MPVEKICEQCAGTFRVKPSHADQRFCGRACKTAHEAAHGRPAAQVADITFNCAICNAPFSMKPSYLRAYRKKWNKDPAYCSTKCGGIGRQLPLDKWAVTCIQCDKPMPIQRKPGGTVNRQKRLCSTKCRALFRRIAYQNKHANSITSRIVRHGYVRLIVPGHGGQPSRDIFEHRYVMEQHLGRTLFPEETVHHINGNRAHNTLENLELFSSRHGPGQRVADKVTFAIEILRLYPEFAQMAGVELHNLAPSALPVP